MAKTKKISLVEMQKLSAGQMTDEERSQLSVNENTGDVLVTKATQKPTVARKNKKVVMLDVPDTVVSVVEKPAVEAVVLDGNLQPAAGKTKKALLRREKTVKAKAAKSSVTKNGHNPMTADVALAILADQAAAEKAGEKVNRKALVEKYNIGIGTIADVLSGQPVIVKMLEKAGHAHPHPRDEKGKRVGVTRKQVQK